MRVSTFHDDPRPAQRERVRCALDKIISDLRRDCPTHIVLNGLVAAARELHQLIDDYDPSRPSRRRAAS
jgi:hypothetical protein